MKLIKYSKYTGFDWDSLSLEDLLNKLSDYLLQSGFSNDRYGYPELGREHNLQDLRDAIMVPAPPEVSQSFGLRVLQNCAAHI